MPQLMNDAAPIFTKYIFPTLASVVLIGIALASLGVGIQVFKWGIGL